MPSEVINGLVVVFLVLNADLKVFGQKTEGYKFMQWKTPPRPQNASVRLYDHAEYDWYPGGPPIIIGLFGRSNVTIRVHCLVDKLQKSHALRDMKIQNLGKDEYLSMKEGIKTFGMFRADTTYDSLTGGVMTIHADIEKSEYPSKGRIMFGCVGLSIDMGLIMSSIVEVLDVRRYIYKRDVNSYDYPSFNANKPMQFRAYPKKKYSVGALHRPLAFEWFYTSVAANAVNRKTRGAPIFGIESFEDWPVQVTMNGYIYWNFMTTKAVETLRGKRIFARADTSLVGIVPMPTITTSGENNVTTLEIIEPESNGHSVTFWTGVLGSPWLPCTFKAGPGRIKISWKLQGKPLKSGFNSEEKVNVTRNYVIFVGPYNFASRTISLECNVEWWPKSGGASQTKTKSWNIKQFNLLLPRLANRLPRSLFVKDREDATVRCEYENTENLQTAINLFGIDTHSLYLDEYKLSDLLKVVKRDYFVELNVTLTPKKCCPMDPKQPVIYRAFNLRNYGNGTSDSHPFSCIARTARPLFNNTEIGQTQKTEFARQVLIIVFPPVSLSKTLSQWEYNSSNLKITTSYREVEEMKYPQIKAVFKWTVEKDGEEIPVPSSAVDPGRFWSTLRLCDFMSRPKEDGSNFTGKISCYTKLVDTWKNHELHSDSSSVIVNIPFKDCFAPIATNFVIIIAVVIVIVILIVVVVIVILVWRYKCKERGEMEERKNESVHYNNDDNVLVQDKAERSPMISNTGEIKA